MLGDPMPLSSPPLPTPIHSSSVPANLGTPRIQPKNLSHRVPVSRCALWISVSSLKCMKHSLHPKPLSIHWLCHFEEGFCHLPLKWLQQSLAHLWQLLPQVPLCFLPPPSIWPDKPCWEPEDSDRKAASHNDHNLLAERPIPSLQCEVLMLDGIKVNPVTSLPENESSRERRKKTLSFLT